MIDFHSHILPSVDDGSQSIEESLEMLSKLSDQGIDIVVATPHFIPSRETVGEFVSRRNNSFDKLKTNLSADSPRILLGAEVSYYEGISKLDNLPCLFVENSRLLLLEMPMCKWSETAIKELMNLACTNTVTIVLAHIERYISYQNKDTLADLLGCGILFQVNASFFNEFRTRHKALRMLRDGYVHFIGSDCHNLSHRPPLIGQAFDLIRKKSGDEFLQDYTEYQRALMNVSDIG
ncbi:MAG: hypothetical protein E7563_07680 [Ruminococcaceae bacterium]|nr:hypothetical protein [Oscillospiraceae bacterium]